MASTSSFAAKASYAGVSVTGKAVAAPRMAPGKGPVSVQMIFKKKSAAPAPVSKKSKKQMAAAVPAQNFNITIPGELFQARNNIKIPVELGFTKGNELFVGRLAMIGFAVSFTAFSRIALLTCEPAHPRLLVSRFRVPFT